MKDVELKMLERAKALLEKFPEISENEAELFSILSLLFSQMKPFFPFRSGRGSSEE